MAFDLSVIIPARDEAQAIGLVIKDLPSSVDQIIVVDNGSKDQTAAEAEKHGALVLKEDRPGYGYACMKGLDYLQEQVRISSENTPKIVVFIDGDYSDYPEYLDDLIKPIVEGPYDLVIGARDKALAEPGAMTLPQRFGNWLATWLMRHLYGAKYTDLGPFRAIRYACLLEMNMSDMTYGWTVEMQLKALSMGLNYTEIKMPYRNRIGVSKVSGTVKGVILAGVKIIGWIAKHAITK